MAALSRWELREWRTALLDIPLDEHGYRDRCQIERVDEIERLWQWWSDEERRCADIDGPAAGLLGFFLLTLVAMHCSDQVRFQGAAPHDISVSGLDARELCVPLVRDPAVRDAVKALYAPGRRSPAGAQDWSGIRNTWNDIDFDTLEFHRGGTTSIIFGGWTKSELGNRKLKFALKCLIYPYRRIPAITNATREYRERYRLTHEDVAGISHLVPVWASHDGWIVMDFVDGSTLAEVLDATAAEADPGPKRDIMRRIDLDELERLGTALIVALEELERHGRHHGDLSPSNIIVERDGDKGQVRMRLIDLGVNYLYSRSVSGLRQGDGVYVAPEVRRDGTSGGLADLYSLGVLLIAISGVPQSAEGTVPDQWYTASVGLARLLEDLIDTEPQRRLLVSGLKTAEHRFPAIKRLFERELEVAKAARGETAAAGRLNALKRLTPGEGLVKRQRQILKARSRQAAGGHESFHVRQARMLSRWSLVSSWFLWATFALVVMWWARDLGIDWQAKFVELLNNILGRDHEGIIGLDDVRADDYPIPDPWGNLPVRIIAFTFVLAGAKWYLNILADLAPRSHLPRRGRRRAITVFSEISIRSAAVLPSVYIVVPTLVQRDWWPLFSAIGVTTITIVNAACLLFARDAVRRAREAGLSTVSGGEIATLEKFASWVPTSGIYGVAVWSIGMLLMLEVLQDELVYASAVGLINIGVFYIIKCGTDAPYVRVGLTRAVLAAERLDHLESEKAAARPEPRTEDDDSAAPDSRDAAAASEAAAPVG